MKIDVVFEGGGVKGIGLVGAVCCLEDKGCEFQNFAGTSAGAFVAALLAAGYKGIELKSIVEKLEYDKLLDKSILNKYKATKIISKGVHLFKDKGIYSGDPIEEYIEELLRVKGKTKFKDVSHNGKSRLKIIASDITKGEMLILPDDLKNYGIDPMEFEIAKAVRMSIGIPIFFRPVKLKYTKGVSFIVDGGILSNYPIWIFDVEGMPKWPTFGMKLVENRVTSTSQGKNDLISFMMDIASAMINKNEEVYIKNKDWIRTIPIPTLGVGATEFNIDDERVLKLFKSGYESANEFLKSWNFNMYKREYR